MKITIQEIMLYVLKRISNCLKSEYAAGLHRYVEIKCVQSVGFGWVLPGIFEDDLVAARPALCVVLHPQFPTAPKPLPPVLSPTIGLMTLKYKNWTLIHFLMQDG